MDYWILLHDFILITSAFMEIFRNLNILSPDVDARTFLYVSYMYSLISCNVQSLSVCNESKPSAWCKVFLITLWCCSDTLWKLNCSGTWRDRLHERRYLHFHVFFFVRGESYILFKSMWCFQTKLFANINIENNISCNWISLKVSHQ